MYGSGRVWLTRGACFVARRLEVVSVAWLLWASCCVLGAAGFLSFFYASNAHGRLQVLGRLSSFTSLLVPGRVQGSVTKVVCLPVCTNCVCSTLLTSVFLLRAVRVQFSQTQELWERASIG